MQVVRTMYGHQQQHIYIYINTGTRCRQRSACAANVSLQALFHKSGYIAQMVVMDRSNTAFSSLFENECVDNVAAIVVPIVMTCLDTCICSYTFIA